MAGADPIKSALNNRVDNFVQIELQRRQFANRYTTTQKPGEPVADFQSISLSDYQVWKPAWACIRPIKNISGYSTLYGTSLSINTDTDNPDSVIFGHPHKKGLKDFDTKYDTAKVGNDMSEYGTAASFRPKPGIRNLQVSTTSGGLYSTITINFKVFDRLQLNRMSEHYMVIGARVLVMFGYADPENKDVINSLINLKHPGNQSDLFKKGVHSLEQLISLYSFGKVYAKHCRVQGFDVNFSNEDASFDITTTLVTDGSLVSYKPKVDIDIATSIHELMEEVTPPIDSKSDKGTNKHKYENFILRLRGFKKEDAGKYDFILPTVNTLFEIGQEKLITYTETLEYERAADTKYSGEEDVENPERTDVTGTEGQTMSKETNQSQKGTIQLDASFESEKSLKETHPILKMTEKGSTLFPNPELNLEELPKTKIGEKQLAFAITNERGKSNKKVDQTYIPWAVCEWIINNGVNIKSQDSEKPIHDTVLKEFSVPEPPSKIFFIPQKSTPTPRTVTQPKMKDGEEVKDANGETEMEEVEVIVTVLSDDVLKMKETSSEPAHHTNFIRSVQFPNITGEGSDSDTQEKGMQQTKTMMLIKEHGDEIATGTLDGKFESNTVGVPIQIFSCDPSICILPGTIPIDDDEKEDNNRFKLMDLPAEFKFLDTPESTQGWIRNILINAEHFYKLYTTAWTSGEEQSLKAFVTTMFTSVSEALNGVVGFQVSMGDDGELQVHSKEVNQRVYSKVELDTAKNDYREITYGATTNIYTQKEGEEPVSTLKYRLYNQLFPLNNFGQDSIVRELSFSMEMDGEIANHFFWKNIENDDTVVYENVSQVLGKELKAKTAALQNPNDSDAAVDILDKKIKANIKTLKDMGDKARTYLSEYLKSAARTYSKLIPEADSEVSLSSEREVLTTKLTKILTSTNIVDAQKILRESVAVPKLPLRVDVTLDGISGIKMYDAFTLTYVPALYQDGHFKVVEITHSVDGTDWMTKLGMLYVEANYPTNYEFE